MGRLLISDMVLLGQTANGSGHAGIVPLGGVLLDQKYRNIEPAAHEPQVTDDWSVDDYVGYGQWLDDLTKDPRRTRTWYRRY